MASKIVAARLRLDRAENRMQRALALDDKALKVPSQMKLFQATCRDLENICKDPDFLTPRPIDMLVGAELFPQILASSRLEGCPGSPVTMNALFGWLAMGRVDSKTVEPLQEHVICIHVTSSLYETMKRFWGLGELPMAAPLTQDEKQCETIFEQTHQRTAYVRKIACLPVRSVKPELGSSRPQALILLNGLEKRFCGNPELK
ncbi:hypothetical protein PR048_019306 [Dryococelus australis]|uniref:Peptidase aspartic putative domain-containing protein n=1 Tax=Dryococelus australis TaxID=614101 RepID=A0ABQ9H375_9NEOP|nr:hypothetical protein PR048_019306 [Dryococelus australis]